MRSRAARAIVAAVGLWAGTASVAHAARIIAVRIGGHADYDRLVLQIEGELQAFHQPARSGELFVLELNAVPLEPVRVLDSSLPRMGRVRIEAVSDGALVSIQARPRRVRAFVLSGPARIVVDFSSPNAEPLPIPEGAVRLAESIAPPWATAPAPTVAVPAPAPADGALQEPGSEITAEIPVPAPAAEPTPPQPAVPPTPQVGPSQPEPGPWIGARDLALGVVVVGAVGALAWLALRRLRRPSEAPSVADVGGAAAAAVPADTITPEELGGGGRDRLEALESRLDEEVRSRSRTEERLSALHEDLKVVRDRLQRMSRQRGSEE
jgi:hypothetical protein